MGRSMDARRRAILSLVNERGTVELAQLREAFPGISDVTLRKDLQYLDDTQQAIRTHGGVKSIPSALNYYYRANVNHEKKKEIAAKAAKLIRPGDSIFISAGTTCAELARCLPDMPLKICSDGVYTVSNIAAMSNLTVEMLGGDVDLNIMRVEGIYTINRLEQYHFTTAFMGAMCVNPDYGFAHNSAMTAAILQKVIERSERSVVLLDSTKISRTTLQHTIPLNLVNTLVTDDDFPKDVANRLREGGLEVM